VRLTIAHSVATVCDNRSVAERVVIHRLFEKPVEEQAGRA